MKRFYLLAILSCGLLGARACVDAPIKVDAPVKVDAEARVATSETTMDPTTNVNPDLWTLAQEIKEVRNTVTTRTKNVQNDLAPWVWTVIAIQAFGILRDYLPKRKSS